jgi:hypothetical protein
VLLETLPPERRLVACRLLIEYLLDWQVAQARGESPPPMPRMPND